MAVLHLSGLQACEPASSKEGTPLRLGAKATEFNVHTSWLSYTSWRMGPLRPTSRAPFCS